MKLRYFNKNVANFDLVTFRRVAPSTRIERVSLPLGGGCEGRTRDKRIKRLLFKATDILKIVCMVGCC